MRKRKREKNEENYGGNIVKGEGREKRREREKRELQESSKGTRKKKKEEIVEESWKWRCGEKNGRTVVETLNVGMKKVLLRLQKGRNGEKSGKKEVGNESNMNSRGEGADEKEMKKKRS